MSEESMTSNKSGGSLSGWIVAAAWLLTFVAGYFGMGEFLSRLVEGILPGQISKPLILIPVLALIVSLALTIVWTRRLPARVASAPEGVEARSGRRRSRGSRIR